MPIETHYNEREIIGQVAEGDEAAFYRLFVHYMPLLRPFVIKFMQSEPDAEEVLQDSFIRVWMYRDRLPEVRDLRAWIFRVTARECLTRLRRRAAERRHTGALPADAGAEFGAGSLDLAGPSTPLELLQGAELQVAIRDAIAEMPEKRRQIYHMSRDQGLKPSEIARQLSLSVGTVKNMLSHALRDIRERLGDAFFLLLVLLIQKK